jgi:hypothetical protein
MSGGFARPAGMVSLGDKRELGLTPLRELWSSTQSVIFQTSLYIDQKKHYNSVSMMIFNHIQTSHMSETRLLGKILYAFEIAKVQLVICMPVIIDTTMFDQKLHPAVHQ